MQAVTTDYLIIGGGLSGLCSAFQFKLAGKESFTVLEARSRLGGRINTKAGVDLGATWLHDNHTAIFNVLELLKLEKYTQFNQGECYYIPYKNAEPQVFSTSPDETPSYRIKGGSSALIQALEKEVGAHVQLNTVVSEIIDEGNTIRVKTNNGDFHAAQVIVSIPPRLASTLKFQPELPSSLLAVMQGTHTWFSHAIKVGISYKKPFWRDSGKSGMVIGASEVLTELYDHSAADGTAFSLIGFVNEAYRDLAEEELKVKIVEYLVPFLGEEVRHFTDFQLQDWTKESFTTGAIGIHPQRNTAYGNPVFQKSYLNDKLHFSGTETSAVQGGYLEGAVYRGLSLAQEMLRTNQPDRQ